MITRKMIKHGYEAGIISLIHEDGIMCQIGEYRFYFGGQTAEEYADAEQYKKDIPAADIIEEIYAALDDMQNTEDFADEAKYYECFLREHGIAERPDPNRELKVKATIYLQMRKNETEDEALERLSGILGEKLDNLEEGQADYTF